MVLALHRTLPIPGCAAGRIYCFLIWSPGCRVGKASLPAKYESRADSSIIRIVVISTLTPSLLAPPPYLFSSSGLGLYALASLIGVVIIYPLAGPLTDMISREMTRRNGAIHEPEHRLPALIFPFLIAPPGLILFAYILGEKRSFYIAGIGYAMQSTGSVLVPAVVLSYVVDAYPRRSGEALVLINAIKQAVTFGFTKAIPTWFNDQGTEKMFVQIAAIQWGILFLALPLYFVSPWLRVKTLRFL